MTVTEGDSGTVDATFTVSLNAPSGRALSVDYATANDTATAPADYTAVSGRPHLRSGRDDARRSPCRSTGTSSTRSTRRTSLDLANPTNATIGGSGLGTITDNDPLPALAIGDVTVTEGDSGTVNATFTVSLSTVSGRTVTVDYATANGTAIAPADYTALPLTALSFSPGQTTRTVTVVVNGDALDEGDETFNVNLSGAAGATIGDGIGVGTITDDDPLPALTHQRRDRHRGRHRHRRRHLHDRPERRERPDRHRRLRDGERLGRRARRLPGAQRRPDLPRGPDDRSS